jgi:SAM-dependent methyltransferase
MPSAIPRKSRTREDSPSDSTRWAHDSYPDYVAEVNRSIAFAGAEQSFFTMAKARRALDLLRRHGESPAAMRLLDIGCGVGLIHPYLAPSFESIVGVDIAADALATARAANPSVRYEPYEGQRLPVEDHPRIVAITQNLGVGHPFVRQIGGIWVQRVASLWITSGALSLLKDSKDPPEVAKLNSYLRLDREHVG